MSRREFSQQGFEASHKDQRQLWMKASSHDRHGEASSIEQMLVHFYTERMLFLHLCLRESIKSIEAKNGKQDDRYTFYFAGCGWKSKEVFWSPEDIQWIKVMDHLMTLMFGQDFFEYTLDAKKTCHVQDDFQPKFKYSREEWLCEYADMLTGIDNVISVENDGIDMQTSCIPSELERKQSVVHEDVAVSQEVKHVSTCEQKVTFCDEELPNIAAGQDRVIAVFPPPPAVGKIQILKMDLETLEDGKEVNDSVVDLFLMYAASKLDEELFNKCHIFSSFFFSKLSQRVKIGGVSVLPCPEDRHASASRFTRNVAIFQKMFLFIPVCRSGHWFLALIYNLPFLVGKARMDKNSSRRAPIIMIDSIVYGSEDGFYDCPSSREQEADLIRSFVRCEWLAKGESSSPDFTPESMPLYYPKVPQQENGYDCGVFVMLFFETFLNRKCPLRDLLSGQILPWYDQSAALPMRERMTDLILGLGNSLSSD